MAVTQIVAGSTARDIAITLTKASDGSALSPASARLQGKSGDLSGSPVDVAMTVAGNVVGYAEFGNLVTVAMLADGHSALYTFRVRYLIGTKVDYSPEFQYQWVRTPV